MLVFCDIGMEPMGGLKFVRRLREHPDTSLCETSVVMLTMVADEPAGDPPGPSTG